MDAGYTPGDMTAGDVSPDFTRTMNVYDSQGGSSRSPSPSSRPRANTWAYEASYAGDQPPTCTAAGPIAEGTVAFNSDGTLANVNGASPAIGHIRHDHSLEYGDLGPGAADHRASIWALSAAPTA